MTNVEEKTRTTSTKEDQQFGPWLRATSDRPPRKTVVLVPGLHQKNCGAPDQDAPPQYQAETVPAGSNDDRGNYGKETEDTQQNLDHVMEIEPNPVFPNPDLLKKSTDEFFNAQLKEIDQAINYIPCGEKTNEHNPGQSYEENSNISHGAKSVGLPTHQMSPFSSPCRRPLGDISNGPQNKQDQASKQVMKPKWKKLAQAHKPTSEPTETIQSHKRDLVLLDEDPIHGKRIRAVPDQCFIGSSPNIQDSMEYMTTSLSAEAGFQPCRKP
ncbi:hypothetical protein FCV25MIE_28069 [Fagus crenata]